MAGAHNTYDVLCCVNNYCTLFTFCKRHTTHDNYAVRIRNNSKLAPRCKNSKFDCRMFYCITLHSSPPSPSPQPLLPPCPLSKPRLRQHHQHYEPVPAKHRLSQKSAQLTTFWVPGLAPSAPAATATQSATKLPLSFTRRQWPPSHCHPQKSSCVAANRNRCIGRCNRNLHISLKPRLLLQIPHARALQLLQQISYIVTDHTRN